MRDGEGVIIVYAGKTVGAFVCVFVCIWGGYTGVRGVCWCMQSLLIRAFASNPQTGMPALPIWYATVPALPIPWKLPTDQALSETRTVILGPIFTHNLFSKLLCTVLQDHNECFVSGGFISCTKMEPGKKSQLNVKFRVKLTSRETSPLPDKLFHIFSWSQKCFIFSPWGRVWRL